MAANATAPTKKRKAKKVGEKEAWAKQLAKVKRCTNSVKTAKEKLAAEEAILYKMKRPAS